MQTFRLRAAGGRGAAAYPLHPRSRRRRLVLRDTVVRRPRGPVFARLSGRASPGPESAVRARTVRSAPAVPRARAARVSRVCVRSGA
jgi:hypothetical protein